VDVVAEHTCSNARVIGHDPIHILGTGVEDTDPGDAAAVAHRADDRQQPGEMERVIRWATSARDSCQPPRTFCPYAVR
jgi:hypothetical protein